MAEPVEEADVGGPDLAASGSDGLAAALIAALGRRGGGPRDDPKLDAFLDEQMRLVRLQTEHLHEQRALILSRLRWGRFSDRMKALLQVMTVLVGVAVVLVIAVMAWQAHEDHGLVIDAFSVPSDLVHGGLTGEVVAARFLDKLQALQAASADSDRPAESFSNNWGADIKVEIPETGVSIGEFQKLLRQMFGQVSHVSGEVMTTPAGVSLTARMGDAPPQTFTGPQASFDDLEQKAAESVYRTSQPYRYAQYLDDRGRWDEAFAVISDLAAHGPPSERGWAYAKWAYMDLNDHGDVVSARRHAAAGQGFTPGADVLDHIAQVNTAIWSGDEEDDLHLTKLLATETQRRAPDTSGFFYVENKILGLAWLDFILPDYRSSASTWRHASQVDPTSALAPVYVPMAETAYAMDHDLAATRRLAGPSARRDDVSDMQAVADGAFTALPGYWIAAETGDWRTALADARNVDAWLSANKSSKPIYGLMQKVWIWPLEALAMARSGDVADAEALIGTTAEDCYLCLRVRGQIAAQTGNWPEADHWFAEAVRQDPSVPFAYAEWGQALLDKGNVAGAIAELQLAHEKGAHFADPLEVWGEALLAKRDYAGAIPKFAEADNDAPKWGRNHLRWGEALMLAGRYAEARAQYQIASGLDLSVGDRAALNVLLAHTATGPLHG